MWNTDDDYNFFSFKEWQNEKQAIQKLNCKKPYNLRRLSRFLVQTLDKIAATVIEDGMVPEYLFDIRDLIVTKIPNSLVKFAYF